MGILTKADEKFLRKTMRYFGVKKLRVQWSDYSRTKYPDIWCYPWEKPPVIVVTAEWNRQGVHERRKRLVHEIAGHLVFGWKHNELMDKVGFSTYPNRDTMSKIIYNDLLKRQVKSPQFYIKEALK